MSVFLCFCLLASGILFFAAWFSDYGTSVLNRKQISLRVTVVGLPAVLLLSWIFSLTGRQDDLLMGLVLITACTVGWILYRFHKRFRKQVSVFFGVCLALYMLALIWVTMISRDGRSSTQVLFSLRNLDYLIRFGRPYDLQHLLLNVLMFTPLGFLIPEQCSGKIENILYTLALSLWLTAVIESVQYLFAIGECDLEDILGNVIGALAGYLIHKIFRHLILRNNMQRGR